MKNIIKSLLMVVGVCLFINLSSQPTNSEFGDVVMPDPNAAALGQYGDIPISYYTGVPDISIPIYNLVQGSLSLPVGLSYHASGINLAVPASYVGQGWSLNAGGVISRTVMGLSDENVNGGYINFAHTLDCDDNLIIHDIAIGELDGEPDIFSFNISGYSGKFYLEPTIPGEFEVVMIPRQDLKIEVEYLPNEQTNKLRSFIITDPSGKRYHFGTDPDDGTIVIGTNKNPDNSQTATNWYLTKIETYDLNHSIDFEYAQDLIINEHWGSCTVNATPGSTNPISINCSGQLETTQTTFILDRIYTINEEIVFFNTTEREDVNEYASGGFMLDKIQIKSIDGSRCKEFTLNYDYFEDNSSNAYDRAVDLRLQLKSLQEKSCNENGLFIPPYSFEYTGDTIDGRIYLPSRLSQAVDHWGYYNGAYSNNGLNENLPPTIQLVNSPFGPFFVDRGNADRETNEDFMKKGVLSKINYPTGGNTFFEFEANTYHGLTEALINIADAESPCHNVVGESYTFDLSIGSLSEYTYLAELNSSNYCSVNDDYGLVARIYDPQNPNVMLDSISFNSSTVPIQQKGLLQDIFSGLNQNDTYRIRLSSTDTGAKFKVFREFTTNGNIPVGGLRIKEITNHDGINSANDMIRQFKYEDQYVEGKSSGILFQKPDYSFAIQVAPDQDVAVFRVNSIVPMNSFEGHHIAYERVVEKLPGNGFTEHEFFVELAPNTENVVPSPPQVPRIDGGNIQQRSVRNEAGLAINYEINSILEEDHLSNSNLIIKAGTYQAAGGWITLKSTYEINTKAFRFESVQQSTDGVIVTSDFEFDPADRFLMPVATEITNSDGKTHRTEMTYPFDYGNLAIKQYLLGKNLIAPIIKQQSFVDGIMVDGKESLWSFYDSQTGEPTININGNDAYVKTVNRFERTWVDGVIQNGTWIEQYSVNKIDPALGLLTEIKRPGWDIEVATYNNANKLTSSSFLDRVTTYTYYSDNIHLESVINPDGTSTSYSYDELSRLSSATDDCRNVVNTLSYTFAQQNGVHNFIKTRIDFPQATDSGLDSLVNIRYLDGLGREVQTVRKRQVPGSLHDYIIAKEYDALGRIIKNYEIKQSAIGNNGAFVQPGQDWEFTKVEFEDSPLSRSISTTPPEWYTTYVSYGSNIGSDAVFNHISEDVYPENSLFKSSITDPEGNQFIEFKDKEGRVVLRRQSDPGNNNWSDTYTIYDDKSRPETIIPPGASMNSTGLLFQYQYYGDDNVRLKQVPDQDHIEYRYNDRGLLAAFQDGNMRINKRWYVSHFDDYGRPLFSGHYFPLPPANETFSNLMPSDVLERKTYGAGHESTLR